MIDVLERINQLKEEKGWTVYKLAEESLVAQSTLSNMFTRKTLPSLFTLSQLCDAFGLTMSEFFDDEKDISEDSQLLSAFRKLDEYDKETVIALAKYLRKNSR